jgi:stalled ribosome rescue protein Dom34
MPGRSTNHGFGRPRRGYAVAALVGLDDYRAVLWIVYSESVKQHGFVEWPRDRKEGGENDRYNFFNAIVTALKPVFSSGVGSLVVASTGGGSSLADSFVAHVRKHHAYLVRAIRMERIRADAGTADAVKALVKTQAFQAVAADVVEQESDNILRLLDARLSDDTGRFAILFSLEEIDQFFRTFSRDGSSSDGVPEHILMTDKFWAAQKSDSRLQRVTDLARNASVKIRVLREDSEAGIRVTQLGGLVCVVVRRGPLSP